MNDGGIGSVIAHEISHGFDDQGAQYDALEAVPGQHVDAMQGMRIKTDPHSPGQLRANGTV